ncbi:hypothetical protein [Methylocystis echinoides]|uniref:hypothetical protein n=1 Tax=Methylocystis echinoides TaxID=29468 RepID=UPI0034290E44
MRANTFDQDDATAALGPIRARPMGVRAALGMGVGASLILAMAALFARHPVPSSPLADAGAPATAEAPAKISAKASVEPEPAGASAVASLDIEAPEFAREKKMATVGDAKDGGPRIDRLTVGQFAMGAPFLRVDVHPELDPAATHTDFFLDMTRHARDAGLNVAKIGQRATLSTRFGAFEAADIRLSQPGGEGVEAAERACLAARLVDAKVPLEIAGVVCGSAAKPIDRVAFACILDGLNYSSGSDNKALNDFFLNAEIARGKGCNVSRDDMTASIPRKAAVSRAKPAKPAAQARKARPVAQAGAAQAETVNN